MRNTEKSKNELLSKFSGINKNDISPEMIKELFPEDDELYEKVKSKLKKVIYNYYSF